MADDKIMEPLSLSVQIYILSTYCSKDFERPTFWYVYICWLLQERRITCLLSCNDREGEPEVMFMSLHVYAIEEEIDATFLLKMLILWLAPL